MIKRKIWKSGLLYIGIMVFALVTLLPIVLLLTNSLMSGREIVSRYSMDITIFNVLNTEYIKAGDESFHFVEMAFLPDYITFHQYFKLFFNSPEYLRLFWNSVILCVPIVVGQCIISVPAAYAFERLQWRYKEFLFFIYIIVMLMPTQVLLVPHYLLAEMVTLPPYLAIILPGIFSPLGVFLLRQQLKGFPHECLEAAQVDGAAHGTILYHIVLPNMKPSLAVLVVITFADYWNIVDQAIVFIKNAFDEPMSIALSKVMQNDTGMFFAMACFYIVPIVVLFMACRDYISQELSFVGVKN